MKDKVKAESVIHDQNIKPSEFKCGYSTSNTGIAKFKYFSPGEYGFKTCAIICAIMA